jgi:MFS family permease
MGSRDPRRRPAGSAHDRAARPLALSAATAAAIYVSSFLNGFTEPNAAGRGAEIQQRLGIGDFLLSAGWIGWPVGMALATIVGGRLLERFGARVLLAVGAVAYWAAFAFIGHVSDPFSLFVVMLYVGVGNGLFDVAFARLGPWYEGEKQRQEGVEAGLVNQLVSACFSAGSVAAALLTAVAVGARVPVASHLAAVSAVALVVTLAWARRHLPNLKAADENMDHEAEEEREGLRARLRSTPWELRRAGIVGFCAVLPVGVGYLWSGIYLVRLGAHGWLSTGGLIAFTSVEMAVRIAVARLSRSGRAAIFRDPVRLTRAGGFVALAGITLIVVPGRVDAAILGFGLLAGGMAPVMPLVQSAAPRLLPAHQGVAAGLITRYTYIALAAGPGAIGLLSTPLGATETATSLRIALACLAVLPLLVIALAGNVRAAQVRVPAPARAAGRLTDFAAAIRSLPGVAPVLEHAALLRELLDMEEGGRWRWQAEIRLGERFPEAVARHRAAVLALTQEGQRLTRELPDRAAWVAAIVDATAKLEDAELALTALDRWTDLARVRIALGAVESVWPMLPWLPPETHQDLRAEITRAVAERREASRARREGPRGEFAPEWLEQALANVGLAPPPAPPAGVPLLYRWW